MEWEGCGYMLTPAPMGCWRKYLSRVYLEPKLAQDGASQMAPVVKNPPVSARDGFDPWDRKIPWSRQ